MPLEEGNAGSGTSNDSPTLTIEHDGQERVIKAEDVKNLLAQQASVTQKSQKIAAVDDAAKKYGLEIEDYVASAENAFSTMAKLMELGLVDDRGQLIEKPTEKPTEGDPPDRPTPPTTATSKISNAAEKAFAEIQRLTQKIERLEKDQTGTMRLMLGKEIKLKYANLDDDDVSRVLGAAVNDQRRSVWEHAEDMSKAKDNSVLDLEKQFAKKYGIDIEEWNANKVREQEASGGAGIFVKGKKLSFRKSKDPNVVSPKAAASEYLARRFGTK